MTADRDEELTRLIGAMCDGTITADEAAQLDSRLIARCGCAAFLQ